MQHNQSRFETVPAAHLQGLATSVSTATDVSQMGVAPYSTEISVSAFRGALGHYASGITIVSGIDDQGLIGFTCQSFYSVSTEPPLISFSVQKSSSTYPRIRATSAFAVNILARHQREVSNQFSRSRTDKWSGISWSRTRAGNPVLDETVMWLDCRIWAEHDAGDHVIVLGKVEEMSLPNAYSEDPLLYFKGRYRYMSAE